MIARSALLTLLVGCSALTDFDDYSFGGSDGAVDGGATDGGANDAEPPGDDRDGDGWTDADEEACGTDPDDADSMPAPDAFGGAGTTIDPYRICMVEQLDELRRDLAYLVAHFRVTRDLEGPITLRPIGSASNAFLGTFDGRGHTIGDVTVDGGDGNELGLFSKLGSEGRVFDFTARDWTQVASGSVVGLVAGDSDGSLEDIEIVDGTVSGGSFVGLLAGVSRGDVVRCRVSGVVQGAGGHTGGLVGQNAGNVEQSSSEAMVTGTQWVGGLIGSSASGIVSQSFARGSVTGELEVGGLVGVVSEGSVRDCYARLDLLRAMPDPDGSDPLTGGLVGLAGSVSTAVVERCYATTNNFDIGGAMPVPAEGLVGGERDSSFLMLRESYYDSEGAPASTRGIGATRVQMMMQSTYEGWPFDAIWKIDTDLSGFPSLAWE